jgi:predicted small lipoprotein YifL
MSKFSVFIFAALIVSVTGCGSKTNDANDVAPIDAATVVTVRPATAETLGVYSLQRVFDKETGVVCYGMSGTGLSCVQVVQPERKLQN